MNTTETTPTATPIAHHMTSMQERSIAMIAKSNAMIALLTQQDVFLLPLSMHTLITGGKEEYKKINELRKKFTVAIKKRTPVDVIFDEVYTLAQERMEVVAATPHISKKYTADDLAAFRLAIDAYKAMK